MEAHGERTPVQFTRTEIDGVPAFVSRRPPGGSAVHAALMFRVGHADEEAPRRGITHLVEHLAMFPHGLTNDDANAFVDDIRTVFHVSGEPDEVASFLASVGAGLTSPPVERLEAEKRVLRTEARGSGAPFLARALAWRCGLRTYGAGKLRATGDTTASDVEAWARERFTRGNASIWVAGEFPDGLELGLREGPRTPPPALTPLPMLELPAYVAEGSGRVSLAALAEPGPATALGVGIARARLHERLRVERAVTYHVTGGWTPLTADAVHVLLAADCLDEHAGDVRDEIVATVDALAEEGPTAAELERHRDIVLRAYEEPDALFPLLDAAATDELLGRPAQAPDEVAADLASVDTATVAAAMRAVRESTIIFVPKGTSGPSGRFCRVGSWEPPRPVEGRRFRQRGVRRRDSGDFVVGREGVTLEGGRKVPGPLTIRYEDCVVVARSSTGKLWLLSVDGTWIGVVPTLRRDADAMVSALRDAIPAEKWVDVDEDWVDWERR